MRLGFFEIGKWGFEKKPSFVITIRYEIPTYCWYRPLFEEGGGV